MYISWEKMFHIKKQNVLSAFTDASFKINAFLKKCYSFGHFKSKDKCSVVLVHTKDRLMTFR